MKGRRGRGEGRGRGGGEEGEESESDREGGEGEEAGGSMYVSLFTFYPLPPSSLYLFYLFFTPSQRRFSALSALTHSRTRRYA